MFSPIFMCGKFVTQLQGIDNDQINKDVLARKDMKLDDTPGNTFNEDSYFPETEACKHLLKTVDEVIRKEVSPHFETYNQWAHILQPNESTMIHTHESPGMPPHLSWVYYTQTNPKCGNIVWQSTIHSKVFQMEEDPKEGTLIIFPNWMPHFTKKNESGEVRISISGNAKPINDDYGKAGQEPGQLFNIIGVV